jgi:two-component system, LytTR family, response regulator
MTDPTPTLRVLIVDDEPMARASLRHLLAGQPDVEVLGECGDGDQALLVIRQLAPDLVFLDIQMPGRTGFEVLEALDEDQRPRVIFTTAYDQYAVRAFEVHAVDYLLKPFDDARFARALARARESARREQALERDRRLADLLGVVAAGGTAALAKTEPPAATVDGRERITIHREGRLDLVDIASLDWVESADQYVRLHTTDGEFLMRESMGNMESSLDPARFLRVHRSAIVALDRVRRLESQGGGVGRLLLADGTWVPVARARMATVRKALG